jgi:DNA-binding transcriptional regulator YbjK
MPETSQKVAAEEADQQEGTRERILRTTLRVIGEQGVGAVSNRLLAAEAGVALGSLTYHFPSQTDLLREALMLFVNEEVERLTAIAAAIRDSEPTEEQVAEAVQRVVDQSNLGLEQIAEYELHLQSARDPDLREASLRCFAAYDEVALAALQALHVPNPERHAPTVVAYISGQAVRGLATGARDTSGIAEAMLVFLRGARASA